MVLVEQTAFMFPVRTFQAGTVGSRYVVIRRGWKVSLINITNKITGEGKKMEIVLSYS